MNERSRRLIKLLVMLLVALTGIIGPARAETVGRDIIYSTSNPIPEIAARVRPAVVLVVSMKETWDPQFGRSEEAIGSGSGVYIDERGYIVTNYHVIEDADRVEVELLDGTVLRLGLQGGDYLVIALGTAVLLAVEAYQERGGKVRETLSKQRPAVQYLALLIPLLVIFFLGVFRTGYISSEFIYKQF